MSSNPTEIERRYGVEYLFEIPAGVPAGRIVVHNHVRPDLDPNRRADGVESMADVTLGMNGFRAWLAAPGHRYVRCSCPWAPELPEHYRVDRAA